jgi:hypothetical protein
MIVSILSPLVDLSPKYVSAFTNFLKAMPNRLRHHLISLNTRIPWFEASELKGFMDPEFVFNRRTDGSQLNDGMALQISRVETLAMRYAECGFAAALFSMPGVCWRVAL